MVSVVQPSFEVIDSSIFGSIFKYWYTHKIYKNIYIFIKLFHFIIVIMCSSHGNNIMCKD